MTTMKLVGNGVGSKGRQVVNNFLKEDRRNCEVGPFICSLSYSDWNLAKKIPRESFSL